MDKKSSVETCRRSPYLCCDGFINSTFIKTALLSAVLILLAIFVILVLIGALYANRNSVFFFVSASILLSAAAMLTLFYIWLNRKRTLLRMQYPSKIPGKTEISTLSGMNYCSQVPSGHKSDFPMGPYLVMTLPKTNNFRGRTDTMDTDSSSSPNTPKHAKKKSRKTSQKPSPVSKCRNSDTFSYVFLLRKHRQCRLGGESTPPCLQPKTCHHLILYPVCQVSIYESDF